MVTDNSNWGEKKLVGKLQERSVGSSVSAATNDEKRMRELNSISLEK